MARIAAIRVDDKQDMVAGPTNSLHSDLAVIPAVVPFLNRWPDENTGRVVEAETRSLRVRRLLASSQKS